MRADVVWGLKAGANVALAAFLVTLLAMSLRGPGPFESHGGFTFLGVVVLYGVAGPLLGGLVGWLRPLTVTREGRGMIGLVCGALFGGMLVMATDGLPWTSDHTMMSLTGGVGGAIGAARMRRPTRR